MWDRKVKWQLFPCAAIIYQSYPVMVWSNPGSDYLQTLGNWTVENDSTWGSNIQNDQDLFCYQLPLQKKREIISYLRETKWCIKIGAVAMKAWMIIVDSLCNQTWQRECPCLNGNMSHQWIWYRTWFVMFMGFPFFATYIPNWGYLCPLQSAYLSPSCKLTWGVISWDLVFFMLQKGFLYLVGGWPTPLKNDGVKVT
jgi:hypothetical protein